MLLTLTMTAPDDQTPATDLGYLLHKHPGRLQPFEVTGGTAYVYYPESTAERCTAALLLDVDPVGLVRGRRGGKDGNTGGFGLGQYVNDRPYAASSLLAVALAKVFRTALSGTCKARPEVAATPLPLEVAIPALPCAGGGPELIRRLFAPLGWRVTASAIPADPAFPEWGEASYAGTRLAGTVRLADALKQLYVLLPVLDRSKHYWVGPEEVDKLIRAGGDWLAGHPERRLILHRYLANQRSLVRTAVDRFAELEDNDPVPGDSDPAPADGSPAGETVDSDATCDKGDGPGGTGDAPARPKPLVQQRIEAVKRALAESGARRVLDLGCGEGRLVRALLAESSYTGITAVDVSARSLEITARQLRMDQMNDRQRARVSLFQSSLTYRDDRLAGFDAAVLMEVIEHVDPERLPALEHNVFGTARPGTVIVTTPNAEFNVRYEGLEAGGFRHPDHRFEWNRRQFAAWATDTAERHNYSVRFEPIGEPDPEHGSPTQMAIFSRTNDVAGRAA